MLNKEKLYHDNEATDMLCIANDILIGSVICSWYKIVNIKVQNDGKCWIFEYHRKMRNEYIEIINFSISNNQQNGFSYEIIYTAMKYAITYYME